MNKEDAFVKIQELADSFLAQVGHPDGGRVTRATLRNVDADLVRDRLIVFKNKDNKFFVVILESGSSSRSSLGNPEESRKSFPSVAEIKSSFITEILPWLIRKDTSIAEADKLDAIEFIPDWMQKNPFSGGNVEKIKKYKELKKELESLGII